MSMLNHHIILLRAIGPITHKIMSMARWREGAEAAGFHKPQTYLATGNMIAESAMDGEAARLTQQSLLEQLGLPAMVVPVVRPPETLARLVQADPFPDASRERPGQMSVYFFAGEQPDFGWVSDYDGQERLAVVDCHLIVDYRGGISESPRLPGLVEKRSGIGTARNWNTLRGLAERSALRQAEAH